MLDKEKIINHIQKEKKQSYDISKGNNVPDKAFWGHWSISICLSNLINDIEKGKFDFEFKSGSIKILEPETCRWDRNKNKDSGYWNPTGCGEMYAEEYGGETGDYIYCPYCGKPIEEVKG